MEQKFDYLLGLKQIHQVIRNTPLRPVEYEVLAAAFDRIGQRLERCGELEMNGRPEDIETIAGLRNEVSEQCET